MFDDLDKLTLFVYHEGLDVPLSTLLDRKLYPSYRTMIQRLNASGGDALDATNSHAADDHLFARQAAHLVRLISTHTATPE